MGAHTFGVFIRKTSTGEIWELLPKSYNFVDELNKESIANFTIGFEDFKRVTDLVSQTVIGALSDSFREIWIERDGVKIFWGVLTDLSVTPSQQGDRTVTLRATSWFGILGKRITTVPKRVFSGVDAGTIAWTLIDESQTSNNPYSDLGITMGSITASKNRDRTYRFDVVKDSIIKLSNANLADGFDFDIDMLKQFNVYYPTKGTSRLNLTFDVRTLAGWGYKKPLILNLVNRVHAIGSGENDDVLYATRNAANSYKADWKLLEETLQEREILEVATLQDKGDRRLANAQAPIVEFEAQHYDDRVAWDDYSLGDTIQINLPDMGLTNAAKRVVKRSFDMDSTKSIGYIKITLQ